MSDVVVTVPKRLWAEWLAEGDLADVEQVRRPEVRRGLCEYQYEFRFRGLGVPNIAMGERVYVVAWGRLRGWAPLEDLHLKNPEHIFEGCRSGFALIRGPGEHAHAVTIPEPIIGFRGWRYRWWGRGTEQPFPAWKTEGVA